MGLWGHGILDDDLALDIKGHFDDAVADGERPADVAAGSMETDLAREILEEFDEGERDEMFWEESAGLFYAAAVLQLEHGVVKDDSTERRNGSFSRKMSGLCQVALSAKH